MDLDIPTTAIVQTIFVQIASNTVYSACVDMLIDCLPAWGELRAALCKVQLGITLIRYRSVHCEIYFRNMS